MAEGEILGEGEVGDDVAEVGFVATEMVRLDGGLGKMKEDDYTDGEHRQGINAKNPADQEGDGTGLALERLHQD